ncbi:MAG: fluoroquinolone resistance protein [Myxococcota bacterium]|jgi:fluoroquinolone resistance protein
MSTTVLTALDGRSDYVGESFRGLNLDAASVAELRFEDCSFDTCSFHEATLISCFFDECHFTSCDLSNARLTDCSVVDCRFIRSKALGVDWSQVRRLRFDVAFEDCELSYGSFSEMELSAMRATGCKLNHADWTAANLEGAQYTNCDLRGSIFARTRLVDTDFGSCVGVAPDPAENRCQGARICLEDALAIVTMQGFAIADVAE